MSTPGQTVGGAGTFHRHHQEPDGGVALVGAESGQAERRGAIERPLRHPNRQRS